ncbi:ATP-binding protein [Streptomyces xinghaiensis]|uniref:ATP-binding protein n=1 Tax=Streptomyces xinghaiensis TaxID=1038928 RepID=UPI002E16171A|nr:ATP-binding protein [Streptomyces xinghaiensis]
MIESHLLPELFLGGGLAATLVALVLQTRGTHRLKQAKAAVEEQSERARQRAELERYANRAAESEARHLVERRLPAVVDVEARGHPGVVVPGLLEPDLKGTPVDTAYSAAEDLVREAVAITRESIGRDARAGVRGIADEAQTYLVRLQMKIDEELDKYPSAGAYHQSLTDIDHFATRALHTLQRLRILAGSWPGVQRANCTFREIVESARGRIDAYDRVSFTYLPRTAELFVEGRVVEPVTVALTELLNNATSYSSDRVTVYVQEVQSGFSIVVEDTGLGMNVFQREEAERLLRRSTVMDVTNLRDERQLGFAIVGRLAGDYGFRADVGAPSAGGGVKAVILVPNALMGDAPEDTGAVRIGRDTPAAGTAVRPEPAVRPETAGHPRTGGAPPADEAPAPAPGPAGSPGIPAEPPLSTESGLPKRRRRGRTRTPESPSQEAASDTTDPDTLAAGFDQMRRALSAGYAAPDTGGTPADD